MDRTKLQAARLYLRIRMRKEAVKRPDLLPALVEALQVVEAVLSMPPEEPLHAAGVVRIERRRFAPTEAMHLPHYEPTMWGRPGFSPTIAATQIGGLR